jgi:hypothetical protein
MASLLRAAENNSLKAALRREMPRSILPFRMAIWRRQDR